MSFRFNFGSAEDDITEEESESISSGEISKKAHSKAYIFDLADDHYKNQQYKESEISRTILENDWSFKHISSQAVENWLKSKSSSSSILTAIKNHSDLLPGVYEGGLKIWECSLDLLSYLIDEKVLFKDKSVLELGCGAGLPGIYAFLKGAAITFQDYNVEVLDLVTIPNLILNSPNNEADIKLKCKFVFGDWSGVYNCLEKNDKDSPKYDIILTSETIYNEKSQKSLLEAMKKLLKLTGVIYLAAKTHYFGVGGGTRQFEELIAEDNTFEILVCQTYQKGVQREILKLFFKNQ